jgi:hypothetical protein
MESLAIYNETFSICKGLAIYVFPFRLPTCKSRFNIYCLQRAKTRHGKYNLRTMFLLSNDCLLQKENSIGKGPHTFFTDVSLGPSHHPFGLHRLALYIYSCYTERRNTKREVREVLFDGWRGRVGWATTLYARLIHKP